MKAILDPNVKEISFDSNSNHDVMNRTDPSINTDEDNIYDVKLVVELTNPNFLKLFSKDSIYVISIEEDAVYLKNKNNPNEIHGFSARYFN